MTIFIGDWQHVFCIMSHLRVSVTATTSNSTRYSLLDQIASSYSRLHSHVLELLASLLYRGRHLALCTLVRLGLDLGRGRVLGKLLAEGDKLGSTWEVLAQDLGDVETLSAISICIVKDPNRLTSSVW